MATNTMIGSGLYDASEVALLVGLAGDQVVRWSTDTQHGPAAVTPSFDRAFSFGDLIALTVARQIRAAGVSDRHLRSGTAFLRERFQSHNPLSSHEAIERLATSGNSFLLHESDDQYDDIGQGGQGTFKDVVRIGLKRVEFDEAGGPHRWVPVDGVVIDPRIQAGAPCVSGTRLPTSVIAGRAIDEPLDDLAFDLGVELAALEAAIRFEELLHDGGGVPA
ncbi:DUF433 domain-containing protein [Ilumatobacter sp.]|uniref:DUF433 domain-containing protein n=1 Tax=Ilumatobacter sp. TaxID=1967498 RepID=UPI003B51C202